MMNYGKLIHPNFLFIHEIMKGETLDKELHILNIHLLFASFDYQSIQLAPYYQIMHLLEFHHSWIQMS
jgi:hypothetical protein